MSLQGSEPLEKIETGPSSNAPNLTRALDFLETLIDARVRDVQDENPGTLPEPGFFDDGSSFGDFIRDRRPSFSDWVVILLALAPHTRPQMLEAAFQQALKKQGEFPQFGTRRDANSRSLIATGETAAFLLAGEDLEARFEVQALFTSDHWLAREGIVELEPAEAGAPLLSGRILMGRDWVELLTVGHSSTPPFSSAFPARRIETQRSWDDLVLPGQTREQLDELLRWAEHEKSLEGEWGFGARLRPGYRALFHGSSGTGKTFAATLLGRSTGREVYRVDLSAIVSKYVGETEKNLSSLFQAAHRRGWILFFDEADALFGKRTAVKDSHDRYANQEVSYLLQRVEDFDGICILASNLRANIDEAFLRRFNAIIRFPEPGPAERSTIWDRSLPYCGAAGERAALIEAINGYELTGGGIVNVAQFAAIEAAARGDKTLFLQDLQLGIRREIEKEGRVFKAKS
ncbi:ATP-binding protein [uncultured Roseibium sp.]|uniref:ATP-binding protein n=1 Tax=uncultured Roseibium sp. TaxID=1936171 RepID=UPI002601C4EA|nr:ATP-binding protein [uncultured Roseibium sp.]